MIYAIATKLYAEFVFVTGDLFDKIFNWHDSENFGSFMKD